MHIRDIELEIKFRITTAKNTLKERGGSAKKLKAIGQIEVLEQLLKFIEDGVEKKN